LWFGPSAIGARSLAEAGVEVAAVFEAVLAQPLIATIKTPNARTEIFLIFMTIIFVCADLN
jgi:hypothetical protein